MNFVFFNNEFDYVYGFSKNRLNMFTTPTSVLIFTPSTWMMADKKIWAKYLAIPQSCKIPLKLAINTSVCSLISQSFFSKPYVFVFCDLTHFLAI